MTNGLRVELLGPPRAWLEDVELKLGPARQRAVFATLAARCGQSVSLGELIADVWGGSAPASATGSVHTYVSGLRGAIRKAGGAAHEMLHSSGSSYVLRLDREALDVRLSEQDAAEARRLLARADQRGAAARLTTALGRWRGEAYSGVPGPFAEAERVRLAELQLTATELRAAALLGLGDHRELVAELTALVQRHPLRESLHETLMRALHASGRQTEALTAYRDARRVLRDELGVEPGVPLRELHQRILDGTEKPVTGSKPVPVRVVPPPVAKAIERGGQGHLPGRTRQVERLDGFVTDLLAGRGRPVWLEGEPGIGKSELLIAGLASAGARGCQLAWTAADELQQRFPLQVIMECLGVHHGAADPAKAKLAGELHAEPAHGNWGPTDPILSTVDKLLALVDETCAAGPLVLVIDDLHWADEASVLLWQRLAAATRQLPLLLVAATRTGHGRRDLAQLRRGIEARDGAIMPVEVLTEDEVTAVFEVILAAKLGPSLRPLVRRAAGNPLYAREIAHDLVRTGSLRIKAGVAEVTLNGTENAPRSLLAAVGRTLECLDPATTDILRTASLLGAEFAVEDLAALAGKSPLEVLQDLEPATTAGVIEYAGDKLAFHHPFQRQALYGGIAEPVRAALHRRAAEALARGGAPIKRVAEQLAAEPVPVDPWLVGWLTDNHIAVSNRAPHIAADLLRGALDSTVPTREQRETLIAALVRVLFRLEQDPEAEAEQAVKTVGDKADLAQMRHVLAALRYRRGDTPGAIEALADTADDPSMPELWRTSTRTLLANFRRGTLDDLDETERIARGLYVEAVEAGGRYPAAHAQQTLWLVHSIRREHDKALAAIDAALETTGDEAGLATLRFDLLDNRLFTLQNLDRLDEADATLHAGYETAARHGLPTGPQVSAAVHYYWTGRWDEALAELDSVTEDGPAITFYGVREPGAAALLLHGVAALIAGHRNERVSVRAHLEAAEAHSPSNSAERESCDFYLAAQAMAAEQRDRLGDALRLFAPVLRPDYARMMLRHQWLPDVVRIALAAGNEDVAREALAVCVEEASQETVPARAAAAAARCRALIDGDPEGVLAAADHYREVRRPIELAASLEDAAELLGRAGYLEAATQSLTEACEVLGPVGAIWNIRRAESRLRRYGVLSRAEQGPRHAGALSPLELRVARLVAAKLSNPEIAAELSLPRRTVQSLVSRVLTKLHADSRLTVGDQLPRRLA
ncbi:BTAD domain-containing putative transcriptional regulator [Amycolatopsis umgeniensis]|uniref:DNA-binding SARP family transcriptional activator/DNA-binding CsgD family transcriptional regulator n=1 Tax=Amycolatopsis umgeniensis TaxID=336628 RepID=A0A841AXX0_9PSEU|nr:DNA-binding SARP family transcriptional activator/DNA-binding CsgD family transcriptional regulator [Amycolatopsis umgeniensis]